MGQPPEIDTSVAHEARMYDYWLGGKDNYAADRAAGDAVRAVIPDIGEMARANRDFVARVVRWLTREAGIGQFLDIGTGIPTAPNVHQVAQEIDPTARVVYTDNDPLVLAHARALMTSTPEGCTAFTLADFRDPGSVLTAPDVCETFDLDEPVALLLVAILMYFDEDQGDDPFPVVRELVDALPSGSMVALTHPTGDFDAATVAEVAQVIGQAGMTMRPRSRDEVARFLDGLDLVEPGIVPVLGWHPDPEAITRDERSAWYWAAVARKP